MSAEENNPPAGSSSAPLAPRHAHAELRVGKSDVPVFNCVVYVRSMAEGGVRARVANLDEIECVAPNERAALGNVVTQFKQRVAELTSKNSDIPWIEPAQPPEPGEQQRLIPIHL